MSARTRLARLTVGVRRATTAAGLTICMTMAAVVLAVPAGAADPINCTPMGDPACRDLAPVVECAWTEVNGSRTVVWGYDNPSSEILYIEPGNKNRMSPGAEDQGQPRYFQPGSWRNVFTTSVPGTSATWRLGNNKADLTGATAPCPTKPVSMIGDAAALAVFMLLMALAVHGSVRSRARVSSQVVAIRDVR